MTHENVIKIKINSPVHFRLIKLKIKYEAFERYEKLNLASTKVIDAWGANHVTNIYWYSLYVDAAYHFNTTRNAFVFHFKIYWF